MREPPKMIVPVRGQPWEQVLQDTQRNLEAAMAWIAEAVAIVEVAQKTDDAGRRYGERPAVGGD